MTALDLPLEDLMTIIITTSPVQSNPSTFLTSTVMNSLSFAPALKKCRKIIICDGVKIAQNANWKAGKATPEAIANYQVYIQRLQTLAEKGEGQFENTMVLPLSYRHGFSYGALEGIKLATTPFTMVIQHDRAFNQPIEVPTLIRDMLYHHKIWVNYVRDLLSECNIANLNWHPNYPPWTFIPTTPGMPPTPSTPARIQYFGSLSIEEQRAAALKVEPKWSVGPDEYTLNHLLSGYPVPFPIPYPQASTGLPINPIYNDAVVRVTQRYNELHSPFDPKLSSSSSPLASIPQPTNLHLPTPFDPTIAANQTNIFTTDTDNGLLPASSATTCHHFITRQIADGNNTSNNSRNTTENTPNDATTANPQSSPTTSTTKTTSPTTNLPKTNREVYPGQLHFRKKQYPHPLPIHYVNFPTNQTRSYLAHTRFPEQSCFGSLPAYFTSQSQPKWLKNPKFLKLMMRTPNPFDTTLDDAGNVENGDEIKGPVPTTTSSSSSSSSSSSDSDSDQSDSDSNNDENDENDPENDKNGSNGQNMDQNGFKSLDELLLCSQSHLTTSLQQTTSTHLSQYQFAPRLVPMMYWFDSTHIALTQWYKELYTTEERGGFPFLRPGDFAEDRYIQFQHTLTGLGAYIESQNAKGNFDTPDEWTPERIRLETGHGNGNGDVSQGNNGNNNNNSGQGNNASDNNSNNNSSNNDGNNSSNNITTTTSPNTSQDPNNQSKSASYSGYRASPAVTQTANQNFIGFPIDTYDTFSFTPDESSLPFIYGAPPTFRIRDLQQVAFRIARCGKVKSFSDAHNMSLREMGLWLFEHHPTSYDNMGNAIQDPISHQDTCLATQWYDAVEEHRGGKKKEGGKEFQFYLPLAATTTSRQMICGHALARVNIQCHQSVASVSENYAVTTHVASPTKQSTAISQQFTNLLTTTANPAQTTDNNDQTQVDKDDGLMGPAKRLILEPDDVAQVWAVQGMDFLPNISVRHLDGKAYLRFEQKLAKKLNQLKSQGK